MLTLFYDVESGELFPVNFDPVFTRESPLLRLDVLGDALAVISVAYQDAIQAWQNSEQGRGNRDVQ